MSDFVSGHDLAVCRLEPRVGLGADSSEPGACFGVCVSLSLRPSPARALSVSQKYTLKKIYNQLSVNEVNLLLTYYDLNFTDQDTKTKRD